MKTIGETLDTVDEAADAALDRIYILLATEGLISPEQLDDEVSWRAMQRARRQRRVGAEALTLY